MRFFDEKPLIYLITKGDLTPANFRKGLAATLAIIEKAVAAEVSLVQIREKSLPAKRIFELARASAAITKGSNTKLLVNDRADVAAAAGADGVHLTAGSLPAEIVRKNFGADFIVGVSAHSLKEVARARLAGANFATFSPIFATASKARYGAPQGIAKLREVSENQKDFPVIALGGIDAANFAEALKAGARGVAAIRLFGDAGNLRETVKKIRDYRNE
ncbi:MAG TPA: thiamine phosphate synthase [Pyrinomonadaceae bacterium]